MIVPLINLFPSVSDLSSDSERHDDDGPQLPSGVWVPILDDDSEIERPPFTARPGPRDVPDPDAPPIAYINLFLTEDFIDHLVHQTNLYAEQYIQSHQDYLDRKPKSRVHKWLKVGPTHPEEIRAFIAIITNIGLIKKSNLKEYWNTSRHSQETPWFGQHMCKDRFLLLLKFIHFNDNSALPPREANRKLYKVKPILDHFNTAFMKHYIPEKDICIDESLVGFRGKTPSLRQYLPNKRHARFGVKINCACESGSGYLVGFEVYQGAAARAEIRQEHGPTHALVLRLMEQCKLLDQGYHLTLDNFFSSPILFQELFQRHTTATGTVRKNRRGLPRTAVETPLRNKETVERRKGALLCVAYQDGKRKPILLSTEAGAGMQTVINRRGQEVEKPNVVVTYNRTMGGVDLMDSQLYMYLAERRSLKWTTKVGLNLIGRAFLNAFILYEKNSRSQVRRRMSRHEFLVSAVEALAADYRPQHQVRSRRTAADIAAGRAATPAAETPIRWRILEGHHMVHVRPGSKKDCVGQHESRTRTVWMCQACKVGLCPPCFTQYHLRPRP